MDTPLPTDSLANSLPCPENLNIAAFLRLFNNRTNSYKFLFVLSILDILARRNFEVKAPISFHDLTIEMLANAWFPHTFFKLSFGSQDTITKKLDSLVLDIDEAVFKFRDIDKVLLRKAIASNDLNDAYRLMDFVPYRLLIPFLEEELANVDKGKWMVLESAMPSIVNSHFETKKLLYKFDSDNYKECNNILFHPQWSDYIKNNHAIIYSWVSLNWSDYMQKRNPSTPDIADKLFMPAI